MVVIAQSKKAIRLLLVDDRKPELEYLINRLQEAGSERYRVEWATSFEEGLAAVRRDAYDIALFDYQSSVRADKSLFRVVMTQRSTVPIILLTESEELDGDQARVAMSVTDCLCKASLDPVRLECSIRYARRHAEMFSALRDSQNRLRLEKEIAQKRPGQLLAAITDNLPIMVGRLDREGRVIEAEGHGLAAQGMAPPRIVGQLFPRLYPETANAIAQAAAENAGNCTIHGRKHGKKWHVELYVFPDASQIGEMVFFGRDVTIRKDLESRLLSISDLEQRRIGADLHDGLGQHLTGTACMAAALCDKLKSGHSPHAAQAASIAALINAAIDMTRGLARGLCPVQIEKGGLGSALEDLSYQVQRLHSIRCSFSRTCASPDLEPHVALHLYRIAQEAINNVLRHSSANEILVTLSSTGGRAILAIEDNGCGFDPTTRLDDHRLGLRLMDYRAAMVGGTLKVSRRKNGGMRVECIFLRSFY